MNAKAVAAALSNAPDPSKLWGWDLDPSAFCGAESGTGMKCDRAPGHGGRWHIELWVGHWPVEQSQDSQVTP